MLRSIFLFGILLYSFSLLGQHRHQLRGSLQDEEGSALQAATIVLFELTDSTIADYTLSDVDGQFKLRGKAAIPYEVQISYLGYVPIIKKITFTKDEEWSVLTLKQSITTLNTAQIEADHIPIRMNGDTLEFNSGAFNVQAHDDLEALLKQMPGVDIGNNGKITVHGKKVEKITVDGKVFFGNNAQIALKNLPADAISKIQSFDKKTDKEELLDRKAAGNTQVLNLVLKEDKKAGYMGNVRGGYGYSPSDKEHRYEGQLNLHHFNPQLRISLIGGINNINEKGAEFGGNHEMSGGDGFGMGEGMELGAVSSVGKHRVGSGGTSMNFFLSEKTDLDVHYLYNNLQKQLNTGIYNRYLLKNNFFTREATEKDRPLNQNHLLNIALQQEINSSQQLRFNASYKHDTQDKLQEQTNQLFNSQGKLTNQLKQQRHSQNWDNMLSSNLYYQKKFKKKGRAIWLNGDFSYQNQRKNWQIFSQTKLYEQQQLTSIDTLFQKQNQKQDAQEYTIEMAYVEPLSKRIDWEWNIMAGWHIEQMDQQTANLGTQKVVNDVLLNDLYKKRYNNQRLLTSLYIKPKDVYKGVEYTLETGIQRSQLVGILKSNKQHVNQSYYFPVVNAGIEYNGPRAGSISVRYETNVNEPSIFQLQPLLNNQNPLYLNLGNPNLVPEFNHNLNVYLFKWNAANETHYYINFGARIAQNAIGYKKRIDKGLRTVTQPINFGNRYGINGSAAYAGVFKKAVRYDVNGSIKWHQNPIFINDLESQSSTQNYSFGLNLRNRKTSIIEANIGGTVNYRYNKIKNNTTLNGATFNHDYHAKIRVTIAKRWNIGTTFNCYIFDELGYNKKYQSYVWSAEASVLLLKNKSIKIIFRAENLLNQHFMVDRSFLSNGVTETRTNLLGRFFMLSLSYKINKMGKMEDLDQIMIMY